MLDILSIIPGKKRHTGSGWHCFNAICCHNRGHKQDRRMRGGIKFDGDNWNYHCFNCQFKCGVAPGKLFSKNTKSLLYWAGISNEQIDKWSFENYGLRTMMDNFKPVAKPIIINFQDRDLPPGSEPLDPHDPDHQVHVDYLAGRGLSPNSYPYYVNPEDTGRQRIIIPYYYGGHLVGNTSRFYDNRAPKYLSEQQRGYVFNIDNQQADWTVCILVEGQFDAISIGGCAYLGSTISEQQAHILGKLRRTIIVVPDRDSAGLEVCDRALELGYRVSIPDWDSDIKDVNDAVKRYGRLTTTLSILEAATSSKIKIEMTRKKFK
jgi:hypothetical protein